MAEKSRRSIRLPEYDYASPGAYFVTICTQGNAWRLSQVIAQRNCLSPEGKIVENAWKQLPNHYPYLLLGEYVIMPDRFHGILMITEAVVNFTPAVGAGLRPAPTGSAPTTPAPKRHPLSEIVRALKSFSSRDINRLRNTPGSSVWQRNYFEHVIRDEKSLQRIQQYIHNNPISWQSDAFYSQDVPERKC